MVPDRRWYDPVLDAHLHTGQSATDAVVDLLHEVPLHSVDFAIDIETPGLDRAFEINCITAAWEHNGQVQSVLLDPVRNAQDRPAALTIVDLADNLILHNAPFDIPALFHHGLITAEDINRVVDTLLLARMAFPDQIEPKNLTSLSVKHLDMSDFADGMKTAFYAAGFKTIQAGYEGMDIDAPIYRRGAMADTVATLRLEPLLRGYCRDWLTNHGFFELGAGTDSEADEIIGTQETVHRVMLRRTAVGINVDSEYLSKYVETVDIDRRLAVDELAECGLEGGSGKAAKLVDYLDSIGELPRPWPKTPTGRLSANKAALANLDHPLAAAQRRLAETDKVLTYLSKVENQSSVTGRCHPQVGVLAASSTGRMSYSSPELQQFPEDARPILCDDGQGLTSIDWSQIEPVTMGLMAKDDQFLAPYEAGEDLYEPLMRAAGIDRKLAKVVLLATMYGQGDAGMAKRIEHSQEQAAQIRRQIMSAMPASKRWMSNVQGIAEQYGQVITAGGRILPVDEGGVFKAVNYCLSPHTLILRANLSHVPARDIRVGDRLVAFDEHPQHEGDNLRRYHQMRTATVETVSTVVKPTMVVRTDDGMKTGCSDDHLWLVRPVRRRKGWPLIRWVRADELEPGDELLSLGRWKTDTSRTGGYLAGLLDGEGHLTRNVPGMRKSCQLTFSQVAGPVLDTYLKGMANLGLPTHHRTRSIGSTSPTDAAVTSGVRTVMRVIGTLRPERFIARAESIYEGRSITAGLTTPVKVVEVTPIGDTELISIQTSTRTLIANGYLSHNCVQGSAYDILANTIVEMERRGIGDELVLAMHDEVVVSTPVASEVREIMQTPPPFLIKWAGRVPVLRTDRADMGGTWKKV